MDAVPVVVTWRIYPEDGIVLKNVIVLENSVAIAARAGGTSCKLIGDFIIDNDVIPRGQRPQLVAAPLLIEDSDTVAKFADGHRVGLNHDVFDAETMIWP